MGSEVGERFRFSNFWRDVAWQSTGASLAQLVGIVGMPFLTRLYSPDDFAAQSLFLQVVTYATALVTWRYEYFVQLPKSDDDARSLGRLVIVSGLIALVTFTPLIWIFGGSFAAQLGNPDVAPWLLLAPLSAVLFSWAVAAQNGAQRRADFKTSGLSELVGKLAYIATGIVGAMVHSGPGGLIATTAVAALGKWCFVSLRRPNREEFHSQRADAVGAIRHVQRHYGRLATSTVAAHLLSTSAFALPQFAIARLYGADALGQFALVMATIFLPSGLLGNAIGHVYYQRAAKQWAEGSTFLTLWRDMVLKLITIGVPMYATVAALSDIAYPFVFGDQWYLAGELGSWMAIAAFATFVCTPLDRTCLIVGAANYSIVWSAYRVLSTVALIWLASKLGLSLTGFIAAFVGQMCLALGIDLWMGYRFSQGRLHIFARH